MTDLEQAVTPPLRLVFGSLFRADFTVLMRSGRALLATVLLPILILVITNFDHAASRVGGGEFLIGLAITYGLLSAGLLGYPLTMARDRDAGVLQRLRITPAPTWTIMTSRLLVQVVANLVVAVITIIVGSIMHHVAFTVGQYALYLAVAIVGSAVFLAIGQALVGLFKSASTINALSRVLYVILLLLGLFGTLGALGSAMGSFSKWTPVGVLFQLFSVALNLRSWSADDTYAVLACAAYIAIFAAIGIRWFRWDSR